MKTLMVTGSAGLIGSEAVEYFAKQFDRVIGIDNDSRAYFFGVEASTRWNRDRLKKAYANYVHHDIDIRNYAALEHIFREHRDSISLIIHSAAQPSHDWAAREPLTDFGINATGTLHMLELTRQHCPEAVFIFTSTNKVYGDEPNRLPLVELETRWELDATHRFHERGIDEGMTIDQSTHSLFGASKLAADILTQEYGRYFDMKTATFRGGCLTGPQHSGTQLHGFLAYLVKCTLTGDPYTVFGYKGKQVRDNIHSWDLVSMFDAFYRQPRSGGEVYNAGGSRFSNCSMLEAIALCEDEIGKKLKYSYTDTNRIGDHIWYISDVSKFMGHYPDWGYKFTLKQTIEQMAESLEQRLTLAKS